MYVKKSSIWQNVKMDKYPKVSKDMETDILIVGGGITGVSLFYQLKNDKRKVTLAEKNTLGGGATSRSSAKITFLQENIYSKLSANFDEAVAKLYYESQKEAISSLVDVVKKEGIDCDLDFAVSYLYTLNKDEVLEIDREEALLKSFGEITTKIDALPNDISIESGFSVKNTYVFHPLKFVSGLAKCGLASNHEIFENTNIKNVIKQDDLYCCYTDKAVIKCKSLVIATHYPSFLIPFLFPLKAYIEKSYLLAKKNKENKYFSAINISNPFYSMRYYQDYFLAIGSTHNLCFKGNIQENVEDLKELTGIHNPSFVWSNHDIMTLDHLPYIGRIKDNLYLATGYNTWGMTNGFLAGILLGDLLNQTENKYLELFSPSRRISKERIIHYPINIFSNVYSFLTSKINYRKAWYQNNPYFTKFDGKDVAIYRDQKNKEHIVYLKCPHLKCNLLFNEAELTWDCPCHGSRFTLDGKCFMGPSNYDIGYKRKK